MAGNQLSGGTSSEMFGNSGITDGKIDGSYHRLPTP
jgi:hypothetical protein